MKKFTTDSILRIIDWKGQKSGFSILNGQVFEMDQTGGPKFSYNKHYEFHILLYGVNEM